MAANKLAALAAGMLLSSQFNVNYFAISEVDQWFPDFQDEYTQSGAHSLRGVATQNAACTRCM
jgi:hypothetical protein